MNNMFLKESYEDLWAEYEKSLKSKTMIKWDYVILTASNENQAQAFKKQIDFRLSQQKLPSSTHYAVLSDPDGKRVGSGGATFNVLKYIHSREGNFSGKRILVIHSGGDSKRIPQYSATGKLFSPVPRVLPDGRRSTLFDEFIIATAPVASRIADGMMVMSGDVMLLFNSMQIDFQLKDAVALSIKEAVQVGKNHGVFLSDKNGFVLKFLHKQSEKSLSQCGAADEHGNVNIDTGAHILSGRVLSALYSLADTEEKFNKFVNERARISFYADFLYPISKNSTLEEYLAQTPEGEYTEELRACRLALWNTLSPYSLHMLSLSPAKFIHFGTTAELLSLVCEGSELYKHLGWSNNVLSYANNVDYCVNNSIVCADAKIGKGSYIENSKIDSDVKIGCGCVISGMELSACEIPDNTVVHGVKLANGNFVARVYPTTANTKDDEWWYTKRFIEANSLMNSLNKKGSEFISLCDSFNQADTDYILNRENKLSRDIKILKFIEAVKHHSPIDEALAKLCDMQIDDEILREINTYSFDDYTKPRIYYYLANNPRALEHISEICEKKCFDAVRENVTSSYINYDNSLKITKEYTQTSLPVRINWGGGWSDTPPYCTENGGSVLNASLKLCGRLPIRSVAKKLDTFHIELESVDSFDRTVVTDIRDIQDSNNPFDPFAIHKAALIACGVIPKQGGDLHDILTQLGGGIYLSTEVTNVPRGSGLGTSSILSCACAKSLMSLIGKNPDTNSICRIVLSMEQLMSTGGGWQDQIGGLTRGIKLIKTEPGKSQTPMVKEICIPSSAKSELQNRFALIYTGERRLARKILRQVMGAYLSGDDKILSAFSGIKQLSQDMAACLTNGDIDGFAVLLNKHFELSDILYSGFTNDGINRIFESIDDLISARFVAGAGGGGFVQVILKKDCSRKTLSERLKTVFPATNIDVWDSEFI